METKCESRLIHHGENVRKWRETFGIKQETMAQSLKMQQSAYARLEQKEVIDEEKLQEIASILKIPVRLLKEQEHGEFIQVSIQNNEFKSAENSHEVKNVIGLGRDFTDNKTIHNPLEELKAAYAETLKTKDELIALLKEQLNKK